MATDEAIKQSWGFHRVVSPKTASLQSAETVDNTPELLADTQTLIDVELLNLDSTSMRQLRSTGQDVARAILDIVARRGKQHNPVTNSGGVLVGRVREVGSGVHAARGDSTLRPGLPIIPVCSMTAIPLKLDKIISISGEQVQVVGQAVLLGNYAYCAVPDDFTLETALAGKAIPVQSCVDIPEQTSACFL